MPAQPNVFKYVDWVAMDTLRILKNKRMISGYFNTDDQKDYNKEFSVGATIGKKFPQRFTSVEGLPYQPQPINRRETTITIDQGSPKK